MSTYRLPADDPIVVDMKRKRVECIKKYMDEEDFKEVWVPIKITGHDDYQYEISNLSRVRHIEELYKGFSEITNISPALSINSLTLHMSWRYSLWDGNRARKYRIEDLMGTHFINPNISIDDGRGRFDYVDRETLWDTTVFNIAPFSNVNYNSKIDVAVVHKICLLLEMNYGTVVEISKECGVSTTTVMGIFRRKRYTEISKYYNIDNFKIKRYTTTPGVWDRCQPLSEEDMDALLSYL